MKTLILVIALTTCCGAAELPDAPSPKPSAIVHAQPLQEHRYWNRTTKISTFAAIALRSADAAQSCYHYRHGYREAQLPGQGCLTVVGWSAGLAAGGIGTSWMLHKLGLHKLENVPNWTNSYMGAEGIIYTLAAKPPAGRGQVTPPPVPAPCKPDFCATIVM